MTAYEEERVRTVALGQPVDPRDEVTTPTRVDTAVSYGVAFLDEHQPGWAHAISLDVFDIGDDCNCVLGQLHGDYRQALPMYGFDDEDACRLGFNTHSGRTADYERLNDAWRPVIEQRQEAEE